MVTQEVHVFVGPVTDAWPQAAATDDDLRAALATVDALTWAEALSDGLATPGHRLAARRVVWTHQRPQQDDELVAALRTTSWAHHLTDRAR